MPANTPKGYPYPLGTDRLMDGDDAIHALATAVDTKLGVAAAGSFTAANSATNSAPVTTAVTFPVGLFTAPPVVVANPNVTDPNVALATTAAGPTAAGCSVRTVRVGGTSGVPVSWIAIQLP